MSFLLLPSEVIEHILISAAAGGFPEAIAAFAQTCKANYSLVYDSPDQHLWREIYLTTFDDPRASGGGPGWGECSQEHPQDDWDWDSDFQERTWAARYIRHQTDHTYRLSTERPTDEEVTHRNIRAFDALLSVIDTALPCPPTIVLSFLQSGGGTPSPTSAAEQYPTFPPLPQAIGGFSNSIVTVGPSDAGGRSFGQAIRARNIAWLESVLANGYPPEVTAGFSGEKWAGGLTGQFLNEVEFHEMQAASQLIACTGLIPIPQPLADIVPVPAPYIQDVYMSVEKQRQRARRLARMRVYNMRYLARERHWGPFLPVESAKKSHARRVTVEDDELLQPIIALFDIARAHRHPHDAGHNHDEEHDENENGDATDNDGMDVDEETDEEDAGSTDSEDHAELAAQDPEADVPPEPPASSELHADWAYLAAVRVVVEANLREQVHNVRDLRGLLSLDGLRPGSAPWDASAYKTPAAPEDGADSSPSKGKGKERATESDECDGWDWAGVTGIWQRCVCWMDYRDLIHPSLSEAVRIIPMRLRIKSYSPCTIPGYEHLPTIHVVGETLRELMPGRPRKMHGTVSIIADGSVRWTLYSTIQGGDTDEWVSEGIQVGGVASAMGILGMWTGAQHERMDPLGPCWAWKVA
ncbi:hypothetical protein K466DRAFT_591391 [Polyporus arcularius HHB13444]|uniref:F-box domain-containing protein n=1 Tax=Polyporus arcularius HHB13444 TaxID=1314778 RepID=A0A5C3NXY0_9APHY|nr:hypothetical protein K466DRAFT_591391 [Polyporus arcularius HHB13444]